MKLTKNFDLNEFLVSTQYPELLVNIHIQDQYKWNLFRLAVIHLQNIRDYIGMPLSITSGYRTPALNKVLKGAINSQHLFGEAADFVVLTKEGEVNQCKMEDSLRFIKTNLWPAVGDCIDYRDKVNKIKWIHISLPDPRCIQRFSTKIG